MLDRKIGHKVHFLFAVRAGRISKNYINDTIIPALCRKAGIPAADVRCQNSSTKTASHNIRTIEVLVDRDAATSARFFRVLRRSC
jgi:hypothetical protein